ncbi:MAG: hypothetical protein WKF84_01015 [Pyrinomonadaceae bacterium]
MVERLRDQIRDQRVPAVMRDIPRHPFVPGGIGRQRYGDHVLPIAANQTISQPYIVARMMELIGVDKLSRVLKIGVPVWLPNGGAGISRWSGLFNRAHRRISRARGAGSHSPSRNL